MSKWIDADALNDAMYHEAFENDASYNERNPMAKWDSGLWIRYKMFENTIADIPSIDIVRCKECKYYDNEDYGEPTRYCTWHESVVNADDVYKALEAVPSADRPQGEWIDKGKNLWKCSNCEMVIYSESEQDRNEFHKWCSRCGARMKGADDEVR